MLLSNVILDSAIRIQPNPHVNVKTRIAAVLLWPTASPHIFIAVYTAARDGSDAAAALFGPGLTGQLHGIIIAKWTSHTRESNEATI